MHNIYKRVSRRTVIQSPFHKLYKIDVITSQNIGKSKLNLDLPMLWQVITSILYWM